MKFQGKFFKFSGMPYFLIMGKIRNIIWTGHNGGFVPRKAFKKSVEIRNVKLKILITFQNCMNILQGFGKKYKNFKFSLSRRFGGGAHRR